jgi:hypothetical protein
MDNPFKFGSVVTGSDFADRRRELAELARELGGGQHLFLLSPRRYGKTSLRQLLKEQVVLKVNGEYRIADPFLREWIGPQPA